MIDAVLSYHTDPAKCGVAKYNMLVARQLDVPLFSLGQHPCVHPLISIKTSEIPDDERWAFAAMWYSRGYDLLFHDMPHGLCRDSAIAKASRVFAADSTIANYLKAAQPRQDIEVVPIPATLQGDSTRPGLNILGFGFAHKFQQTHFERLKALLDRHGMAYTVSMSAAVHEGREWETIAENERLVRGIFGEHARFLGYLADDALAREIRDCHMIALFYEPAVRANNTTLWAALEAGTPVITNLDKDSPKELQHGSSIFDLAQLTHWPDASECREVRFGGREAAKVYSWDRLIGLLKAPAHV